MTLNKRAQHATAAASVGFGGGREDPTTLVVFVFKALASAYNRLAEE